jgi:hypothetical protein
MRFTSIHSRNKKICKNDVDYMKSLENMLNVEVGGYFFGRKGLNILTVVGVLDS